MINVLYPAITGDESNVNVFLHVMRAERKSFSALESHGCVIPMVLRKLNLSDDVYVHFIVKHNNITVPWGVERGQVP